MNPDSNFITSLFNIDMADVESLVTRSDEESVTYDIKLKRKFMTCPYCRGPMIGHGRKTKKIDHPVLRNRKGYIIYHANRYICKRCGKTCFENNPFAMTGFNSSTLLLQHAMQHLGNLNYTLDMISKELNISNTQLNTYVDSFITIPRLSLPESLGIDELYSKTLSRKNATFLCILVDNEHRCVNDVLDSRSKYFLERHFANTPRDERAGVRFVTIDMWEPYRDVAEEFFPNASVAVDPFHVINHLCDDFDTLRISLMNQCDYNSNGYYLLKKWNWLLTKSDIDLDNEKELNHRFGLYLNRRDIRNLIFETFPVLHTAYELKELYRRFNRIASYEDACKKIDDFRKMFSDSNIRQYDEFVRILTNWRQEIINSFQRPYDNRKQSNAFTENINGKLRTYLSVSRGISNFPRFRKRVLYALNPKINYALTAKLHSEKRKGKARGPYEKPRD